MRHYPKHLAHVMIALCLGTIATLTPAMAAETKEGDTAMEAPTVTYRRFTVEEKDGRVVRTTPIPDTEPPLWARDVSRKIKDWSKGPDPKFPYFQTPIRFVHPPKDKGEPFFGHNHVPSVIWLNNGDLLAAWYSTRTEQGKELTMLASRLREGAEIWDPSSEFFKAVDRNMSCGSLFSNGDRTIYHINGISPRAGDPRYDGEFNKVLLMRASTDMGVTWSPSETIFPEYSSRLLTVGRMLMASNGMWIQQSDWYKPGFSTLLVSSDNGKTWSDRSEGEPEPAASIYDGMTAKGLMAGVHNGVVEISNGRLMALARTRGKWGSINGKMHKGISSDWGKTWTYSASPFPPISSGQRLVLMRLMEGPILLVSFTSVMKHVGHGARNNTNQNGLEFTDGNGKKFMGYGMFAALSFDEGETWPVQKLLTPGSGSYENCGGHTGHFTASPTQAEPGGYLSATQTPDGVIHLISSALHYRFNLAWLKTPNSPDGVIDE